MVRCPSRFANEIEHILGQVPCRFIWSKGFFFVDSFIFVAAEGPDAPLGDGGSTSQFLVFSSPSYYYYD